MPEEKFYEQKDHTNNYLIPYFEKHISNFKDLKVLEVGCAEAGLMDRLSELGFEVTGIEIDPERAKIANEKNPNLKIIVGDISAQDTPQKIGEKFDLVIMREVIEHVPDKERAFKNLSELVKPEGYLYVSFPPKYSAFAGHQQVGLSPLKAIPWVHLLPKSILNPLVKLLKEHPNFVNHVKTDYGTGMAIGKFEKLFKKNGFEAVLEELFIFRPIYQLRFGLPVLKSPNIPALREVLAFGCETLLKKKRENS